MNMHDPEPTRADAAVELRLTAAICSERALREQRDPAADDPELVAISERIVELTARLTQPGRERMLRIAQALDGVWPAVCHDPYAHLTAAERRGMRLDATELDAPMQPEQE